MRKRKKRLMLDTAHHHIPQSKPPRQKRRWILALLTLGLGSTLLLTFVAGGSQTLYLLRNANLFFVGCILLFQGARYVAMTISTRVVAEIVQVRVPFLPLFQATVAAQAANRTLVGGAGGMVVRVLFFLKRGMHTGTFAGVEGIEDVVSLCVVALMFVSGLAFVLASGAANSFRWDVIGMIIVGVLLLVTLAVALVRRREVLERAINRIARTLNLGLARILRRNYYSAERVHRAVDDFYQALALAQSDPVRVFISFCCAFGRLGCDWMALYFAYRAIGFEAELGTVLLIFVVSSSVSTIAAVPGQIGVMETTLALMSAALGIPVPIAVSGTLLYRLISFLLPIPFGYAFAWNLQRRGLI